MSTLAVGVTELLEVVLRETLSITCYWLAKRMLVSVSAWSSSVGGPAIVLSHLFLSAFEGGCSQSTASLIFLSNICSLTPCAFSGLVIVCQAISGGRRYNCWNRDWSLCNCVYDWIGVSNASTRNRARPLVSFFTSTVRFFLVEECVLTLRADWLGWSNSCWYTPNPVIDWNSGCGERDAHRACYESVLSICVCNWSE